MFIVIGALYWPKGNESYCLYKELWSMFSTMKFETTSHGVLYFLVVFYFVTHALDMNLLINLGANNCRMHQWDLYI